ncbi:MAG: winged helix-turn-helix domain-containing protein [Candidatus Bathyarchaeota archaeon]|nr:winged helix-turn-helix domain-containing protein [Candidatus Termiticorpusculum sp.]
MSSSKKSSSKLDLYVIARIIEALKERKHLNRTALATVTGLSYDRLVRYLSWMSEQGFVTLDTEGIVHLTNEGQHAYEQLVQWILKHIGQLKFRRLEPRT